MIKSMNNYTGSRCPVCEKKFTASDDIVVCPICGAPHHRECYSLKNQCAFEDEHEAGKVWEAELGPEGDVCINPQSGEAWDEDGTKGIEFKVCGICGSKNPKDNLFCCSCGNRLAANGTVYPGNQPNIFPPITGGFMGFDPSTAIYGGVSPSETIDEFSVREVATFVGRSSHYYIPQFKAESTDKKRFSFSLAAFFLGPIYFFYRKMYGIASIALALFIALSIPGGLYAKENLPVILKEYLGIEYLESQNIDITPYIDEVDKAKVKTYEKATNISSVIRGGVNIIIGSFAIKLYYAHTMRKMKKVKETQQQQPEHLQSVITHEARLKEAGGVNLTGCVIAVVAFTLLNFGFYLYQMRGLFPY